MLYFSFSFFANLPAIYLTQTTITILNEPHIDTGPVKHMLTDESPYLLALNKRFLSDGTFFAVDVNEVSNFFGWVVAVDLFFWNSSRCS